MRLPAETGRLLVFLEEPSGFLPDCETMELAGAAVPKRPPSVAIGTVRNRMKDKNKCSITIPTQSS